MTDYCDHANVILDDIEDVDDERVRRFRAGTCLDCGADLVEKRNGELVERRAK
jgi:hypothetical protein